MANKFLINVKTLKNQNAHCSLCFFFSSLTLQAMEGIRQKCGLNCGGTLLYIIYTCI